MKVFIDSNIPMYVAGRKHPNQDPSRRFLRRVREGKVDACTSTEVLQEILYRYASIGRLDLAREVYDLFVEVCPVVASRWPTLIVLETWSAERLDFRRATRFTRL
jgi:predicted nucleic acid-binding protein